MASHKAARRRRLPRRPGAAVVAAPLAVVATAGAVGVGVMTADVAHHRRPAVAIAASATDPATGPGIDPADVVDLQRAATLSRGYDRLSRQDRLLRPAAVHEAEAHAHVKRWTTVDLDLWTAPGKSADQRGELPEGKHVLLTGRELYGRDEIVVGQGKHAKARWVTDGYFSSDKPLGSSAGLSDAPCPDSSVEYRLSANAIHVYRSVCHAFPQITSYGGWAPRGEHASGNAIDIMTSDPQLLVAIADYLQAHASRLHLYDIIRLQHIWTPVRASEGWRLMPDRGSETANHMDHVHVSTY